MNISPTNLSDWQILLTLLEFHLFKEMPSHYVRSLCNRGSLFFSKLELSCIILNQVEMLSWVEDGMWFTGFLNMKLQPISVLYSCK